MASGTIAQSLSQNNNLGTGVNLSSYTTTYYECPYDGYLQVTGGSSGDTLIRIYSKDNNNEVPVRAKGDGSTIITVFVRKGMRLSRFSASGGGGASFFPLSS